MWKGILAIFGFSFAIGILSVRLGSLLIPIITGAIAIAVITIILYGKVSEDESEEISKIESDIVQVESGPDRVRVNYITKRGSSIGGKILLHSDSIVFSPNRLEEVFGREPFEITYEEVKSIEKVPKQSDGLAAIFLRNGLSDRIQINLEQGTHKLFSTSDIESAVKIINKNMNTE